MYVTTWGMQARCMRPQPALLCFWSARNVGAKDRIIATFTQSTRNVDRERIDTCVRQCTFKRQAAGACLRYMCPHDPEHNVWSFSITGLLMKHNVYYVAKTGAFLPAKPQPHTKKALSGNRTTRLSDRRPTPACRYRLPVSFLCILMSTVWESHVSMSKFPN